MHSHTHEMTLGLAFFLGALHALEPGHGKTAMLVYLSGERRSFWHPLVMGISSGVAHSVSLIAIAMAVHLTHHLVSGDHHHENDAVTQSLQWISAGLVMCVGLWMLWSAWRAKPMKCGCKSHQNGDCDAKSFSRKSSYSMSALLGVAFGLLPCPSALAAYFTSMSTGSPVAAYTVIGLFAAGIACSLSCVGILLQRFGGSLIRENSRFAKLPWPYLRAGLILGVGVFYCSRLVLVA
ncbi:HoxN/HupN/NixA family nickel/cobalt transporter [Rhodopirellula halodulae]|uniref:HoxN/HupN/NixA family nickel/cobalt transporter n=1 Tax=Rhodopirellula halodulae TaxID=2894198 RepID=UPI001E3B60BB|nr:sulfite exporter TauE/SafE family protein [Rhodopirellula sp. JC737]MCC9655004.1 sulfite exporter TauE/SafE family protein [Rhodopirellula sp. JC737]